MLIKFEWDPLKNEINIQKHGVSFEEASSVFRDAYAIEKFDAAHSIDEDRFILIGMSQLMRELVVSHCHREGNTIRIISASKANNQQIEEYWKYR